MSTRVTRFGSVMFCAVMISSGCASSSPSPPLHLAEVRLDDKNSVFVASRDREIRLVLFLKTSKIVPGKRGYDWPDEDGVKGAYCLNDGSVLTFEYSFADDVVEIGGKKYDSSQGRVFLAESKTKVDQLSATLNPLPPPGVPQRLADDAERLTRENPVVMAFLEP